MSNVRTGKRSSIKAGSPEVEAFVAYLRELIKARTSENQLFKAAKVGNSKLLTYLDGTHVPHQRVLDHYILRPLSTFGSLSDDEHGKLMELHQDACRVQNPREPTDTDKIKFLQEDLAQARGRLDGVTEELSRAVDQNIVDSEQAQLRLSRDDLHAQVRTLANRITSLRCELERSEQEYQAALEGKDRKLAEFAEEKRKELDGYQEKISRYERAVTRYANHSDGLRKDIRDRDDQIRSLKQENAALRKQIADERLLFMALVNHVSGGEVLARVSRRHEQGEQTIAQLTETNRTLTETNRTLTTDLDRVAQERDFLRATTVASVVLMGGDGSVPGPAGLSL